MIQVLSSTGKFNLAIVTSASPHGGTVTLASLALTAFFFICKDDVFLSSLPFYLPRFFANTKEEVDFLPEGTRGKKRGHRGHTGSEDKLRFKMQKFLR